MHRHAEASKYENSKGKEISEISIAARADGWDKLANIDFEDKGHWSVWINLTAREDVLLRLKESIDEIVSGTKPWFSPFARLDFSMAVVVVWVFAFIVTNVLAFLGFVEVKFNSSPDISSSVAFNLLIFASIAIGFVGNKLRTLLFPKANYLIGQGIARYRILENVRWVVVVGFAVSFLA